MIVYKITNSINSKVYFGITKCSLRKRWNEHKSKSKRSNSHLYFAMRKYGIENFKISLISNCDSEFEMYQKEIDLIKHHKSNNPDFGYNNSLGGEISSKGKTLSKDAKKKISVFQKQRKRLPHSEETKQKMRNSAKGRDMNRAVLASAQKRKGKPSWNGKKVILNNKQLFNSIKEASLSCGICAASISNNINGLSKKTKLGVWKIYKH